MNINTFMSSLSFDIRLAPYDIAGSIAHARMLKKCGIIPANDAASIIQGLKKILQDIKKGKPLPDEEDVHMAIEKELIKRIGPVGGKLHTARSRNDQVALDMRLYVRDMITSISSRLTGVQQALITQAKKHSDTIMPGYTHLQHGQPVALAHHCMAYAWMIQRDKDRLHDLFKRVNISPLGSAAFAGTSFPIDRACTARMLGMQGSTENSLDAVSDRDFVAEMVFDAALIMMHVSRLAEELVLWSSQEFGFVQLGTPYTAGSSIMPNKKNPDFAEIIRSKTGRVYGSLMGILTVLKALPLSYNRDLQEDKPLLFDAVDTVLSVLSLCKPMIATLVFDRDRLTAQCRSGFMEATELADFLVKKGLPFRKAHGIVRQIISSAHKKKKHLSELSAKELQKYSKHFDSAAHALVDPKHIVSSKKSSGGTAPGRIKEQIRNLEKIL
ncbi:MAG: argininosuccinate lyase [Elusimicrobia bacterium]|nr:argininosuccinate lyase [Elusimicrobiota bacterium]MBD3411750.1 argininosuccinate lyase [Elusimicrobiota bacterium]